MTQAYISQLIAVANKLADLIRITGDEELTEIFDELIICINQLEG